MGREHAPSSPPVRVLPGYRGLRRIAVAGLVALPLLMATGSEPAEASCTYNVGSGQYHSIAFSSHWSDFGGYGSWDFHPGQSQCWYDNGWDSGWIAPPHCWLECDFWPEGIDVDAHGWIDICAYDTSGTGPQWAYRAYAANGTPSAYAQSDYGYPPGCTGALGSSGAPPGQENPPPTKKRPIGTDSTFFTGRAASRNVKSITFHLRGPGGKPLGSVCMPPVSVSHMDLSLAKRRGVRSVYVGIVKQGRRCDHPKVAGRERAGRPRPDVRFASFCQGTGGKVVRTFRYPDDFKLSKRPSCR